MAETPKVTGDIMGDCLGDVRDSLLAIRGEIAQCYTEFPVDPHEWARVFGRISKLVNSLDVSLRNAEDIVMLNNRLRRVADRHQ